MPDDDRGIFEYLREHADSPAIAGLAYSAYISEKHEWSDRQASLRSRAATKEDVDAWISGLTESRLDRLLIEATDLFDRAARAYTESHTERAVKKAASRAITAEVRQSNKQVLRRVAYATSYWRNFLGNIFIGFVSSIVFVLVVAGGAWIFASDPSPFATLKQLFQAKTPEPASRAP